ncbi:uncharacterized protein C1orf131 [Colletes gigas]|uniref:uncharacterized protein C1orf131 n=1 Tax=Colletes gigas TaxID=935657 RepID=UPI001C9B9670|nr:uncharacterized protein C1orf131 [Colletes gigas]XP_043254285.1 uncharacterized protein C1orf131 [Colletes gigas]XP_043254286.1 uncharacterized protein C1orf131 [Colletes gigas]XP_043254287.1 uncharacterized protein C1orf131 [Colletes gigas]XP_043254288.1 uncharacterized protein C1orf131 [Colletes gigas]XP_043254290.1 uncharacterized protein C1orf131 [Colletes gigas]
MEDFIPTRVSRMKKDVAEEFVSVNYKQPRKKVKDNVNFGDDKEKTDAQDNTKEDQKRKQELEMKRFRYEVMRFGISGFEKAKAKKSKIELVLNLGAKPPKNRRVNYKTLKMQKARQKEKQQNEKDVSGAASSMVKHKTTKIRKKKSDNILEVYGKVSDKPQSKKKKKMKF